MQQYVDFEHTYLVKANLDRFFRHCCEGRLILIRYCDVTDKRGKAIDLFHNNFPLADSSPNTVN